MSHLLHCSIKAGALSFRTTPDCAGLCEENGLLRQDFHAKHRRSRLLAMSELNAPQPASQPAPASRFRF